MTDIITIDGPSCSGKGTIAKSLAKRINYFHLESGLLYRVIAKYFMDKSNEANTIDERMLHEIELNKLIEFNQQGLVSRKDLYTSTVSNFTSTISQLKSVRDLVLIFQRSLQEQYNLIAEGRDMGSIVFPKANLKIYIDAPISVRAERRYNQLKDIEKDVNLAQVFNDLVERDKCDSSRQIAPLQIPLGAILIDTSLMNVNQAIEFILSEHSKR